MSRSSTALLVLSLVAPACSTAGATRTTTTVVTRAATVADTTRVAGTVVAGEWFQGAPVRSRVLVGADGETYVGLWIDAPTVEANGHRLPLDVALVVDTSGSMSGAKIESARMAAASFIDNLAQGDIVSLYAFSGDVRELSPPVVVDDATRAVLLDRVRHLYAAGGTNLWGGLHAGQAATASAPASHPVRRVVVISDGRANVGPSTAAEFGDLAAGSTENGTQITAIGVGLDYDEETLGALAVRSAGRLYHLEQPEQMAAILQGELQMLSRTVATNAVIEFVPAEGVVIEATEELRLDRVGDRVRIPVGSLYSAQRREVLLRARVRGAAEGNRMLGRAQLVYQSPGADAARVHSREVPLAVEFVSDEARSSASAHERVQAMVSRFEAAQSQMRAAQLINEGQAARAEAELQRAEERLRAAASVSFSDERVQGQLLRQAAGISTGRAAARRAVAAPSAAATRGASLQNRSSAMDSYGY
ncbi:MAG: VWA domain-containing protein [Myxococcales bacterium]|nr:VWA domain-containing protein [Myxococcales bacterium]